MSQAVKKDKKTIKEGAKIWCDIRRCAACKACELACAVEHSASKELAASLKEKTAPKKRRHVSGAGERVFSLSCQHCEDAPCVTACMSGAMYKDKDGVTRHDPEKCVGCWMCIMVCPFGAISRRVEDAVAVKCDLCPDREGFACVDACPTGALFAGTVKEFEKKLKDKKE